MPLKLVPPREGKTKYYYVRGTYLGRYVDRSTGCADRATAKRVLAKWGREIESGEFAEKAEPAFAAAALRYVQAGGATRFLKPIMDHFGPDFLLRDVTQEAIERAALALYPNAGPATRNRQVFTPISAVLKHVGEDRALRRPKGGQGRARLRWLWPEELFPLLDEAAALDREFGALVILIAYTGLRLGEALAIEARDLRLAEGFLYLPRTKNEDPRPVALNPFAIATLSSHPRGLDRPGERLFRFGKGGHLYSLLKAAAFRAGVDLEERDGFHLLRHTWATWMRRYGGLDTRGLVGTRAWKDPKSAARYEHVVVTEEARKVDLLPVPKARLK